ncbi:MAG TPA: hypothetical protein VED59_05440, partial [Acidimicrobiales bacterium]|nr:hypothetical protein [Acidimicrobiales bacterium]
RRLPMRSPYRLVPIVVAVFIVAVAIWQASEPRHAGGGDIAAAKALVGKCLIRNGGTVAVPSYSSSPVSCSSGKASVRVIAVLVPGQPGSCPRGSSVVQVLQPGVVGEPYECLLPLKR